MKKSAWARWMALARRAAEIQAHVLFFLLYVVALVPLGFLNPGNRKAFTAPARGTPEWRPREASTTDLAASRRQY